MRVWIVVAVLVASGDGRADVPARAPACRLVRPYVEPMYFLGPSAGLHRVGGGLVLRDCSGRERPFHARIGPTIHFANDDLVDTAYGGEAEAGLSLSPVWRAGLRVGFEVGAKDQYVGTVGLRFRAGDLLVLGVDVYGSRYRSPPNNFPLPPLERRWGVMVGAGFEGKVGSIIVAAEALIVLTGIALASH
ncbi:MAG TPA: hypothetical protein VNO30_02805 [Kofleriaceae bacterium]|nr:hypothetical protein [Kofleriaceae bacterium]